LRFRPKTPSPAMVVALIALFVSMGGMSYAVTSIDSADIKNNSIRSPDIKNNSIRSNDIKDNSVRSKDIRRSTIQASDVGNDVLAGGNIRESSLGKVPTATDADTLGGNPASAFASSSVFKVVNAKLANGQSATLAQNGPLKLTAKCDSGAGPTDRVRVLAETSTANAFLNGVDNFTGSGGTPYLQPDTTEDNRELLTGSASPGTTVVSSVIDNGWVAAADGSYIGISAEMTTLGLNAFGSKCAVIGPVFVGHV
jgi:hypothetical protein